MLVGNINNDINILIASDILPPGEMKSDFTEGNLDGLLDEELQKIISSTDCFIVNLECVLGDENLQESDKVGSHLLAPAECVNVFSQFPSCVVNLANNHILDYGQEGAASTVNILKRHKVNSIGLGDEGLILNVKNSRIGIYSIAEHDFGVVEKEDAGYYPNVVDTNTLATITQIRKSCDSLVVLYHGGLEFYPYPTPKQQERLRKYVDAGADLIVCQHNHVISCRERWNKGTIIYGQGGFLFSTREEIGKNILDENAMKHGMLVNWNPILNQVSSIFYEIENGRCSVEENSMIKEAYEEKSREINDDSFVGNNWNEYAEKNRSIAYLANPHYIVPEKRNFLTKIKREVHLILDRFFGKDKLREMVSKQTMRCESTSELVETILKMEEV